jgi:ubiquinone/menaquinone biosynthesis C-methylase UbiE
MVKASQSTESRTLLDIGCGKGELLGIAAKRLPRTECIGVDVGNTLGEAKRKLGAERLENVQLLRGDGALLPFRAGSAQLVFCASVLEHLVNVLPALLEIERVLDLDGSLVIGVPTENRLYRISRRLVGLQKPKDHYHGGGNIERLVANRFVIHHSFVLPLSFLPRFLSLYLVIVCSRKGGKSMGG